MRRMGGLRDSFGRGHCWMGMKDSAQKTENMLSFDKFVTPRKISIGVGSREVHLSIAAP